MAQMTEMKLMATSTQSPIFLEKGTLSLQMTGIGRTQITRSSSKLHALLKPSNARISMQFELESGFPVDQKSSIGVHWKIPP